MKINQAFKMAFKKFWRLGFVVAFTTWIIAWFVRTVVGDATITITAAVVDVREQILQQGVAPGLGLGFLDFLRGYVPIISLPSVFGLLIGSLLLVLIGMFFRNWFMPKLPFKGNVMIVEMLSVLLYGTIVTGLLMGWITGIGIYPVLLALAIYYLLVAVVIALFMRLFKGVERFVSK